MTISIITDTVATLDSIKNLVVGLSPIVPWERRYGVASITPEDLEGVIARDVAGARLEDVAVQFDSKGTTDRAHLQLTWNELGRKANLPTTAFAKGTPSISSSRILNAVFGLCESEVRFYNELYEDLADITLKPYLARLGSGGRFVIVLEDLRNETTFLQPSDKPAFTHVQGVIDALAKLHAQYWRSPRFDGDLSWIKVYAQRPGYTLANKVVKRCEKWLLERDDAPGTVLRLTRFYLENRKALDHAWETLPQTLCHGDSHLANTYALADGRAGLFDWQNIHKMNGMRDVAYFIGHSLSTDNRRAHEAELIEYYLERLAHYGVKEIPTYSEAYDIYRLLMMDAWTSVWATLAIGGMADEARGKILLKRFYETLVDLDTESALREAIKL